jgi:hypothetical protein
VGATPIKCYGQPYRGGDGQVVLALDASNVSAMSVTEVLGAIFYPSWILATVLFVFATPRLFSRAVRRRLSTAAPARSPASAPNTNRPIARTAPLPFSESGAERVANLQRRTTRRRRVRTALDLVVIALLLTQLELRPSFNELNAIRWAIAAWFMVTWTIHIVTTRRTKLREPIWLIPGLMIGCLTFELASIVVRDVLHLQLDILMASIFLHTPEVMIWVALAFVVTLYGQLLLHAAMRRFMSADAITHVQHWWMEAALVGGLLALIERLGIPASPWWALLWVTGSPFAALASFEKRAERGPTLVYLRSFAQPRVRNPLLRAIGALWLEVGPIDLLTGPDVTQGLTNSAQVLAWLTLRLRSVVLATDADVVRATLSVPDRALIDGRFALRELACGDAVWASAVRKLLEAPHVRVVMDLRGIRASNAGTLLELGWIADALATGRAIAIADPTIDLDVVNHALMGYGGEGGVPIYVATPNERTNAQRIVGALLDPSLS